MIGLPLRPGRRAREEYLARIIAAEPPSGVYVISLDREPVEATPEVLRD